MSTPGTAWALVLDELELDVRTAETLLEGDAVALRQGHLEPTLPWVQPLDLGPMPEHLRERASRILARQHDTTRGLWRAARSAEAQLGFASRVAEATHAPAGPAYLDVSA